MATVISHVCAHWRCISLENSALWSYIDWGSRSAKTCLLRSRGRLISMEMRIPYYQKYPDFASVTTHLHRTYSLHLSSLAPQPFELTATQSDLFNMRQLTLVGVAVDWSCLSNLTCLTLSRLGTDVCPTPSVLIRLLHSCSRLRRISLGDLRFPGVGLEGNNPRLAFCHLEVFELSDMPLAFIIHLLQQISIPQCAPLYRQARSFGLSRYFSEQTQFASDWVLVTPHTIELHPPAINHHSSIHLSCHYSESIFPAIQQLQYAISVGSVRTLVVCDWMNPTYPVPQMDQWGLLLSVLQLRSIVVRYRRSADFRFTASLLQALPHTSKWTADTTVSLCCDDTNPHDSRDPNTLIRIQLIKQNMWPLEKMSHRVSISSTPSKDTATPQSHLWRRFFDMKDKIISYWKFGIL